jgi:hypothetical protein
LLLFWLPPLSLANDIPVLVNDVSVVVDLPANQFLRIAFNYATDNLS